MRFEMALLFCLAACSSAPQATITDKVYASGSSSHRLNLYRPRGQGPFPLVVMVHGGGFMFGDHRDVGPGFAKDIAALNDAGIAVASVGYRLSGEATFPAAVRDVKAAIRHLRQRAAMLGVDPARIALWGKSAGGNLVLMAGLTHGQARFDDPTLADSAVDDRVRAIVAFYPPIDFAAMDQQLREQGCKVGTGTMDGPHGAANSPESRYLGAPVAQARDLAALANPAIYVRPGAPAVLLAMGSADCNVPPAQSRLMLAALRAKAPQTPGVLIEVPGAVHADAALDSGQTLLRVRDFLILHLQAADAKAQ